MMPSRSSDIREIVDQFVTRLSSLIEEDTVSRARDAVLSAFGGHAPAGVSFRSGRGNGLVVRAVGRPGRPPGRKRRKGPIQLCPVPGCTNRAAPVFGMVCAKHKDMPKAQIKKYREQRRADKLKGKAAGRRGPKPSRGAKKGRGK
jgi:hypothetical protein